MASAGTSIQNVIPQTPTNIQEIQSDDSSVTISWDKTLGNENLQVTDKWYEVYANSGAQGEFVILPKKFGINQYTATDLQPAVIYKFKVAARNCCGRSGFTKEFPITVFKKPDKPVLPCPVSTCDGQMQFQWNAPNTYDSAITAIEFIILDNNLQEHIYQPCSIIGKTTCLIFSRTLLQAPYNLPESSLVRAYIRMQNQGGWSAKSEDHSCRPEDSGLKVKPCQMTSPSLVEDKNSVIKLKWNKCPGNKQDTKYILKWNEGDENMEQKDFVRLTTRMERTDFPTETHKQDKKRKFTFSIQAENQLCGISQPAVLKVVRTFAPTQMKCVTVRQQQCATEFSWEAPQDNGGSDVTDYKIQVQKGDGTWEHLTQCNQCQFSGKCQCTVQMRFLSEQLKLKKGQEIIVRASSRNKVGWSSTSDQCSTVKVIGLPDKMAKPVLTKQHPSTITANWQQCSSSGCYYQLFWGVSGSQKNQLTITDKNQLEHIETGLSAGVPYEFCIRYWNVCGTNELSCDNAKLAKRPEAVSITQLPSTRKPCTADFAWKPAEDNGAPVTAYEVQVASPSQQTTGPTQWNDLATCMTKIENQINESESKGHVINPMPSASFSCQEDMKTLAASFNLKIGDDIYYRIRAKNLVGWGAYTPAMRNNQRMITEPMDPIKPKIDNYSKDGFRVCWQAPPGLLSLARIRHDYKFFLHHNEGKPSIALENYSQVKGPTTDLCHIFNNLNRAELHNVYVSVENECGRSGSPISNVPIAHQPSAPECTVGYKNCALQISWSKPQTTEDAPVTGYKVSLGQAGSGNYVEYAGCGDIGPDSADKKCYVQMKQLANSGLYDWFKPTNQIQIAVQGTNMHGSGAKCNSIALPIKSSPPRLGKPTAVKNGMDKINLNWDSTCNGECWYQIRISQPGAPTIVKDLQKTEYVLELPDKTCTTYTFEVTAHNECGNSDFSEATSVVIGGIPNPPVLTASQANKCGVNLSWDSPLTSCPIQKYIVEMKTGQNKWVTIPTCGTDKNNRQCTIFMNNLLQMYGLQEGDIVKTRAKAMNCCGWSDFSAETGSVAVKTLPSKVSTPERVGQGLGAVTIRWTSTCVGPDCRYVVIITDPTTNQPQIQEVQTKEFIHANRLPCVQYAYTVTAKNACGTGAHSGPLFVSDGAKPATPLCLQTRGPSCSVQITWEDVRGEDKCLVTGYEVEIQNSLGAWMKLPGCGTDLSKQDCMIKMGKLMKDYELTVGTAVVTRARASNCCGWSKFSVPHSSDIRINQEPQEIMKPECIKITAKGFTMKWPAAANRSILYCNNGAGTKFVPRYTTSADSTVNVPAIPGVEKVTCYLQAVNECGTKQSEHKDIVMPRIPDPLVSSQNQLSDCQLEISWNDPQDNGEPVTHFIVEVQSGSGLWAQAAECGNSPTDRKCMIKMTKLGGAPFFLSPKSPITSRVRAVNAVGISLYSTGSNTEVLLAGLPPVMATPKLDVRSASEISICWDRSTLTDSQDVEFFWGTSPRTAFSTGAADGLDQKFVQVDKTNNCNIIKINANAQQLYRFVVRATNNCGPAPFSPELTVNLCGPNCNHSFQSSVAQAPVYVPNGNILPPTHNEEHLDHHVEHTDGHGPHHQHVDKGVTAVIVQPTPPPVSVVTIQEKPVIINNNLPPPILPDNMVQECDSQTGRCWFTTKPAVIPIISTGGTITILQPNVNENENLSVNKQKKVTKSDTQGWSSGPTEDVPPMKKVIVKPAPVVVKPTRKITKPPATGGWTSDGPVVVAPTPTPAPVRPSPTPKYRPNTTAPATGGWSSGTTLPVINRQKPRTQKPKKTTGPQPSTSGSSTVSYPKRPSLPIIPVRPITPVAPIKPTKRATLAPATGGWTSGGSTPSVVPKPAPSVIQPTIIPATRPRQVQAKESFTGAWSSDNHHQDGEALLAGADSVEEEQEVDPDCPAPPTPDAINCKMEESVAALDWYPEDQYGSALLQSEPGVTFQLLQSMPGTDEFIPMYEGPTPQYTISVQEGNLVKFKIRSKRDCGTTSPWQEVSCGGEAEEPKEPQTDSSVIAKAVLSEDLAGCGVKIAWTEPKDFTVGDVQEYKVEINTASGFQVLEGCGKRGIFLHCSVSSIKLMKEPFNMQPNDVMEVRVSAHTTNGWTEPSPIAKMQMTASNFPAKMNKPKLISNNSSTITLTWGKLFGTDEGSSKINSYKLEWTDGVNAPFTRIFESSQQVYTIAGIIAGRTYNIKISAMNSCGFGEYSDSLEVTAAGCPTTSPAPSVAIKGKDVVVISWEVSETEAHFPLREYQVLFKSKDGSYMEHKTLCDGSKPEIMERRTCMLAMWEVPKFTGLNPGDLIQVKVRASNRNCHGEFSKPNAEGQEVNNCPAKIGPVTSEKKDISKESITVGWNLKAHQFEIRWQECDETVWTRKNSARTNAQSYKHSGLVNASCQRYIVRAYNSNCRGEWSEGATFTSGEPPAPLGAPIVSVVQDDEQSHSILITWPAPPAEDKVTGYAVFVGTSSGEYKEDKKLCNGQSKEVIETRECHVPMSTFWEGTYRKDQGTFIGVRVQASNIKGDSDLSPWNVKGPRVEKVPFQMNRPTATKSMTEAAIILEWEEQRNPLDGGSPIVSYNLQFKRRGEDEKWQDVVGFKDEYLETSYIHTDLPANEKLHYRIRAQNRWGWGQYSTPDLVIDTPKAPQAITKDQSTVISKTGDIMLTWEAPDSNGSEIQGYKVEIQNSEVEWTEQCSTRDQLKCKVRMSELRNKFKLQLGQLVNYRIRAINLAGPGPWSNTNTVGATIRTEPDTMPKLTRGQNTSETQIHVTWQKLTTDKQTGDSEILGYVLQEDGREIYSGMDSEATFDAEDGRIYKLRIAAWNIYGLGEFSGELRIRAGIMPAEISSVRATSVNDDRIKIEWDLKGKNKVKAYEVKIYSKVKGAFETVSKLCDGTNPEIIAETACTVDADVLARNYGYSLGDLFVAKVRAQNSRGWGAWSRRSGATVFRYDAEADLP